MRGYRSGKGSGNGKESKSAEISDLSGSIKNLRQLLLGEGKNIAFNNKKFESFHSLEAFEKRDLN